MTKKKINVTSDPRSGLLPDPRVAARYDVTARTIDNWDRQPGLNFPKAVRINNRKYRRLSELESWERQQVAADSECAPYSQKPELKDTAA